MAIDLVNYESRAQQAVRAFWRNRQQASRKQQAGGKADQGERSSVTAGKNMDGFLQLITDLVSANGLTEANIMRQRQLLTLPGYFRPTKVWDLLLLHNGQLIAALEFKSQVGPSFGNNANNRAEEAIGTALDLWTAYREGAFGDVPRPFVGYLILIEDAPGSRKPVEDKSPHFPVFPEFRSASYANRYNLLCKKLVQEQLYTAATLLLSPRSAIRSGQYTEMSEMTGLKTLLTSFAGHIAAAAARG